jgi:hypothetical protein
MSKSLQKIAHVASTNDMLGHPLAGARQYRRHKPGRFAQFH